VHEEVGKGAFGTVYRATLNGDNRARSYAMKVVAKSLVKQQQLLSNVAIEK
jgi:serine/threonine protein kinase